MICSIFLFFYLIPNETLATATQQNLIKTYYEDVTGDGLKERIELFGVLFSQNTNYYKDIFIKITSKTDEWKINYGGGYSPKLQFIDLNHDRVNDVFFQSYADKQKRLHYTQINTVKHGDIQDIPLPSQHITGKFKDDFKLELRITPLEPQIIDVSDYKRDYIRLDIYNKEEKLLKRNMVPLIDPIAFFEPIRIHQEKGFGLKSLQHVKGAHQDNHLGTIETLWFFENESWIILKTTWKSKPYVTINNVFN